MTLNLPDFTLTRFVFQRLLAGIYFTGFLIAFNQFLPLCGANGLLPARLFIKRISFWESPSLFYFFPTDTALLVAACLGLLLSLLALLGVSELFGNWLSALTWFLLWLLYLSFVNVGQTFYGFGWETLLLETGFLAVFLGGAGSCPNVIMVWLLRWLLFRLMFGAGMIKIRGDSCWRDLTCLQYHFETQPLPGPLSRAFHHLPKVLLQGGVLFNHFAELIVPFGIFGPRRLRIAAGLIMILFQCTLIVSGNLSWLNCITIVLCFACFDDRFLGPLLGPLAARFTLPANAAGLPPYLLFALAGVVAVLSLKPALNLLSDSQAMNASFEPLHLVNTYGAFGSITRERDELIIEGTEDSVITDKTPWKEYSFKAKPGALAAPSRQVTPYHYKIDWQMWFAAMSPYYRNPWLLNLIAKILQGDKPALSLLGPSPFPEQAPKFVRVLHYRYQFTAEGEKNWWDRTLVETYLPPLSLQDKNFRALLEEQGWLEPQGAAHKPH